MTLCMRLGCVSELAATQQLIERGHKVAIPVLDDDGVDLVVDYRLKVQVKSAVHNPRSQNNFSFMLNPRQSADKRMADIYLFHAREPDVWWVATREQLKWAGIDELSKAISLTLETKVPRKFSVLSEITKDAWGAFDRVTP